ncbi:hypothetical protein GPA19_24555 [Azoarcus indigens]|uniref:hypothetical protein n=1 Tax=Azoarcus indigens TaxID=29545 RepID=UPI0010604646|nr:hypothetical protein [Azoarcus indigens]NMG68108.1 hypothetical protein [Azoarcus indigens]
MYFPSTLDFIETFGLVPVEEDPSMAYCRYLKKVLGGKLEIDISFSAVAESFQVVLRCNGHDVITVSSESVKSIEIRHDGAGSGVNVLFDIDGVASEAWIGLEPEVNCRWWALRST